MTSTAGRKWTAERIRDWLGKLGPTAPVAAGSDSVPRGYLEAAAVLDWFDPCAAPAARRPRGRSARRDPAAARELQRGSRACVALAARRRPPGRAQKQLVARGAVSDALAVNPQRPDEPAQRLLEAALSGRPIDVADIARMSSLPPRTVHLLAGIVANLPEPPGRSPTGSRSRTSSARCAHWRPGISAVATPSSASCARCSTSRPAARRS